MHIAQSLFTFRILLWTPLLHLHIIVYLEQRKELSVLLVKLTPKRVLLLVEVVCGIGYGRNVVGVYVIVIFT